MSAAKVSREKIEKKLILQFFRNRRNGVFIEVGANEPVSPASQTWYLEDQHGWTGVLVEPILELAQAADKSRPRSRIFQVACGRPDQKGTATFYIPSTQETEISTHACLKKGTDGRLFEMYREQQVEVKPLNEIIDEAGLQNIDLLSIDTEGTELDVLKGLDLKKHRPGLILLEDKHVFLNKHLYLKRHGYKAAKRMGMNTWYIPKGVPFSFTSFGEKLKLFKHLYLSLIPRKIKAATRLRTWRPLLHL
ncbi:MAG: FkbM family methyltransferase [Deltaproteobacteria bacterium]|nr:FkbM family methyltransferase [Deltaproteobacteria bacterium]